MQSLTSLLSVRLIWIFIRVFSKIANKRNISQYVYTGSGAGRTEAVNGFQYRTAKQVWLGDVGAYPVIGVIVFAVGFCTWYGTSVMLTHPDARIGKTNRTALFRGELKNEKDIYN